MGTDAVAILAALLLAAAHLLAGRLGFLDVVPRSRWLSFAGGISVAYVFVHLLPELSEAQRALAPEATGPISFLEQHAYLLALVGLTVFYGLERSSRRARAQGRGGEPQGAGLPAAWVSIGTYAGYNGVIGYLLVHRDVAGPVGLGLFALAMGVHFIVNDQGLRRQHGDFYHRVGRWLCAGGVLLGCGIGLLTELPEPALALLIAFLAGGVVLNVLKEELPTERESRFTPFVLGAASYTALLLLTMLR